MNSQWNKTISIHSNLGLDPFHGNEKDDKISIGLSGQIFQRFQQRTLYMRVVDVLPSGVTGIVIKSENAHVF